VEFSLENRGKLPQWISLLIVVCAPASGIFGSAFARTRGGRPSFGIYSNSACTSRESTINWGLLDQGSNKTVTVYVRNEGKTAVILTMTNQNWNPTNAAKYIAVSWNYAGQALPVNQVLQVRLTLDVSPAISGITDFTFDTTISAAG